MSKCGQAWIKKNGGEAVHNIRNNKREKKIVEREKNACYIFLPEYVEIVRYLLMLDYKAMNVLTLH
jgi:hypothetical protein